MLIGIYKKNKKLPKKSKRKLIEAAKKRWQNPEYRKKQLKIFRSSEYREKQSELSKGRRHTEETKNKIGNAHRNKIVSEETKRKQSESHMGRTYIELFGIEGAKKRIKKQKKALKGIKKPPRTKEHTKKIGDVQRGKPKPLVSKALKGRNYISLFGIAGAKKKKKKISVGNKIRWQNIEYKEKRLKSMFNFYNIFPNKPEKKLNKRLNHMFPNEYKFVGDGTTFIGGKCPDFININGQKKIIEMNGNYWHGKERTGRTKKQEENQRIKHFAKYGFKTLIIWQNELKNIKQLKKKLIEFHNANI